MSHPKEADTAALLAETSFTDVTPPTSMRDGEIEIRVVDLPTLIDIKSKVGRTKDKLVVAELIVILDERRRRQQARQ